MSSSGMLAAPLPAVGDPEGERVPEGLPFVVDAHVHLFPDRLFEAVWAWFDRHGWPIRYRLHTPRTLEFLLSRGIGHVVALHYAHKPGIARGLNEYMAQLSASEPRVTALATVLPGEPDARAILDEAFALGLGGVKLHCHVQCFAPDAPEAHEVYAASAEHGKPLVLHAGREPKSPAYRCDPHELCSAERVERVLRDHPRLKLCVPHLGADELDAYGRLLERYDNLWLDTTMAVAGYLPGGPDPWPLVRLRPERMMYGTDFPNIPYAWDRELRRIVAAGLPEAALEWILGRTAAELFGIARPDAAGSFAAAP
jgi:uncharacterized protein